MKTFFLILYLLCSIPCFAFEFECNSGQIQGVFETVNGQFGQYDVIADISVNGVMVNSLGEFTTAGRSSYLDLKFMNHTSDTFSKVVIDFLSHKGTLVTVNLRTKVKAETPLNSCQTK